MDVSPDIRVISFLQVVSVEQLTQKKWELTSEGSEVIAHGSHEALVYKAVPPEGLLQTTLMVGICFLVFS